ncbi:MAG: hypothetical protein EOP87_01585 [Verrucomicrobiaceae bacterium]|nr:MAG: hypothetical protein EOP87_01585 [Verrucomicrobiaceae bacterium]
MSSQPAIIEVEERIEEPDRARIPEPSIGVPPGALRRMLATCRHGLNPRVGWSENRPRMDQEAMQIRGETLGEIESQLERLLGSG